MQRSIEKNGMELHLDTLLRSYSMNVNVISSLSRNLPYLALTRW